jgi:DNA-binding beta-propeller fold protein YncE
MTTYSYDDDLSTIFVGRRIVSAEVGVSVPEERYSWSFGTDPAGLLTLDDGTKVYVAGNEGGCSCSSGCYYLEHLAAVDNVITSVEVISDPSNDYDSGEGYKIFVYADNEKINIASFEGSDGNGYYGTGFYLKVFPA